MCYILIYVAPDLKKNCNTFWRVIMDIITAYKLFLVDHESYCSASTMDYYRENISKFLNYVSDCDCNYITRDLVLGYLGSLRDSGRKNTTINTYFRAVKVFLNYCIDEGYCSPDVLRKVKFLKSDHEPVIPLSEWEVEKIDGLFSMKTESGIRNLCMIHLMLDAGFRSSDVVNLRFGNINFVSNYLIIKGKGDKFRSVILCPKLKRLLYHYLLRYRAYDPQDDYPVFVKVGSSTPINSNVIKQLFSRIKVSSGLDRIHPHLLRHTFATSYILGGGNMEFLRMMLGHSDYETTKIYLHLAQQSKMLHNDVYRLDPVFFKSAY